MNLRKLNYNKEHNITYILKHLNDEFEYNTLKNKLLTFNNTYNWYIVSKQIIIYDNYYYQLFVKNKNLETLDLAIYKLNDDGFGIAKNKGCKYNMGCHYSLNEILDIIIKWR